MNDVLASLYTTTGKARHMELARAFNHDAVFDPLARGEDALDGLHGSRPATSGSRCRTSRTSSHRTRTGCRACRW